MYYSVKTNELYKQEKVPIDKIIAPIDKIGRAILQLF